MRFLIFNFEYPPLGGGGGVATKQIAEELAHRHEVTVITTAYRDLARKEVASGVTIIRVPVTGRRSLPTGSLISMFTFVLMALVAGIRLCLHARFDVINAQFVLPSGVPAALVARFFSIPLVVSFIGGDVYDPTKGVSPHRHASLRFFIRLISRQATLCTAISADTKKRAQELHHVTCETVITHLGLMPTTVTPATRQQLGLPEDVSLAVSVGRLIPRKSYDILLEAFAGIPDAHLAIIGDGPWRKKMENTIRELGCGDRIHLLGFLPEEQKLQVLRAGNLYVSAAEHEGFGIVFLEAMDAGLPIVAVNEGGQTDFLTEGENALLVAPHNAVALRTAVQRMLADNVLAEKISASNIVKVKDFYLERTVKTFENVLIRARDMYEHRN